MLSMIAPNPTNAIIAIKQSALEKAEKKPGRSRVQRSRALISKGRGHLQKLLRESGELTLPAASAARTAGSRRACSNPLQSAYQYAATPSRAARCHPCDGSRASLPVAA